MVKVAKKVFVFLGMPEGNEIGFSVKLPESGKMALTLPFTEPTGYGLGKSGWITAKITAADAPMDLFCEWIDESYRAVAPRKLVAAREADVGPSAGTHKPAKTGAKKSSAKKTGAKKTSEKKTSEKKTGAKKASAKKASEKKTSEKKASARPITKKSIAKARGTRLRSS